MDIQRRTVLQVTGLAAVGGLVAACGSSGESAVASSAASAAPVPPGPTSGAPSAAASGAASAASGAIAAVADIPVGGGLVLENEAVVLTQPTAGDVKAFSAICTHQGCLVSEVVENEIVCPCHGSRFSAVDGAVITGPAQAPLASAGIVLDGGSVVLG